MLFVSSDSSTTPPQSTFNVRYGWVTGSKLTVQPKVPVNSSPGSSIPRGEVPTMVPPAAMSPALLNTSSEEMNACTETLSELIPVGPSKFAGPVPIFLIVYSYEIS